jgi:hypothetical protein
MILFQESDDSLPHSVIARLTDKRSVHADTPQRDNTVEHRTARHSPHRLVVSEDDIENRLANTNNLSHSDKNYTSKGIIFYFAGKDTNIFWSSHEKSKDFE